MGGGAWGKSKNRASARLDASLIPRRRESSDVGRQCGPFSQQPRLSFTTIDCAVDRGSNNNTDTYIHHHRLCGTESTYKTDPTMEPVFAYEYDISH